MTPVSKVKPKTKELMINGKRAGRRVTHLTCPATNSRSQKTSIFPIIKGPE